MTTDTQRVAIGTVVRAHWHFNSFLTPSDEPCSRHDCSGTTDWVVVRQPAIEGLGYGIQPASDDRRPVGGPTWSASLDPGRFEIVRDIDQSLRVTCCAAHGAAS